MTLLAAQALMTLVLVATARSAPVLVTGEVIDDTSGHLAPARIYIQDKEGRWYFPKSASRQGSVFRYERRNGNNTNAVEMHATMSAHPFTVELEPGAYTFTAIRRSWPT